MNNTFNEARESNRLTKMSVEAALGGDVVVNAHSGDVTQMRYSGTMPIFENTSKMPATDLKANYEIILETWPGERQIGNTQTLSFTVPQMVPNRNYFEAELIPGYGVADVEKIKSTAEVIIMRGDLAYKNGFGRRNSDRFCFIYGMYHNPEAPVGSSNEWTAGWQPCFSGRADLMGAVKARQDKIRQELMH